MNNFDNGYWQVGDTKFTNKYQALLHSTRTHQQVRFFWHDETWSKVKATTLGRTPLKHLYKQRALQLRNQYDYLALSYSGGSDSWNVLNTFIENKIKLDCVVVRWPLKVVGKVYTPNRSDTSAFNFLSEWDFVIQKDLQWIATHHPDIRIEVVDWFEPNAAISDDKLAHQNIWYQGANVFRMQSRPRVVYDMLEKGRSVGEIVGVDKPLLQAFPDGNVYMFFTDAALSMASMTTPDHHIGKGIELFYWSPSLPQMIFEQAYQLFLLFKRTPALRYMINESEWHLHFNGRTKREFFDDVFDAYQNVARKAIYPDWDFNKFQALKPRSLTREDKDWWFYKHPENARTVEAWRSKYSDIMNSIHPGLRDVSPDGRTVGFKGHRTRFYRIGNYND